MPNYDELLNKYNKLLKENEYLKGLLKKNNINFEEVKIIDKVEMNNDEKIELFLSYFKGRSDVFATRYESTEGKTGYSPVCKNRFANGICDFRKYKKCIGCPNKEYYGFNSKDIEDHLKGKKTIGVYSMLDGDICYFLAVDFDDKDFMECANEFRRTCKVYGIDCAVELSRSGSGAHVWFFFENAIKARDARKIGDFIMNQTFNKSKSITFASFDRFFPSQDYLIKEGYGNLIALPCQGEKVKEGKTVFVDENFIPYESQSSFLRSVRKLSDLEINVLLEQIKDNNELEILPKNIVKKLKLTKNDFKDNINIVRSNGIVLTKDDLNLEALKYLMRLGSIPNRDYYEKQNSRISTYGIPRVLQLFKEDDICLYLPRGCYEDLILILDYLNVNYNIIDQRNEGNIIPVIFKGELKSFQKTALEKLLEYDNGILVAPTAFGKTIVAISLISELKTNVLILVDKKALLTQWKDRLETFLDVQYEYSKKNKFGTFSGEKKKLTECIDVGSIHSFDGSKESREILSKYGLIIIDEAHHGGARTYEQVIRNTNSKYIYGFTATPKRSDGNERIVYKCIGDIRYIHEDISISKFDKILVPKFTRFSLNTDTKLLSYPEICSQLYQNESRNELIVEDVKKAYNENKNIMILTDRIEHIKIFEEKVKLFCDNIFVINGQMKMTEKNKFHEDIKKTPKGFIIISTGKYVGEGFDNEYLNCLFLTMPFKWDGTLAQYVGRLHRNSVDKKEVHVYDYVDLKISIFSKMFNKRLKGYKKLGYLLPNEKTNENRLFGYYDYEKKLIEDLNNAKTLVFISSQVFNEERNNKLLSNLIVIVELVNNINSENDIIANVIIIDNKIIWYGGINPLNDFNRFDETIMRLEDEEYANDIISQIKTINL